MLSRNSSIAFLRNSAMRWDLAALVVTIGLVAFLGDASRGLFIPLKALDAVPLSLDPLNLSLIHISEPTRPY